MAAGLPGPASAGQVPSKSSCRTARGASTAAACVLRKWITRKSMLFCFRVAPPAPCKHHPPPPNHPWRPFSPPPPNLLVMIRVNAGQTLSFSLILCSGPCYAGLCNARYNGAATDDAFAAAVDKAKVRTPSTIPPCILSLSILPPWSLAATTCYVPYALGHYQ